MSVLADLKVIEIASVLAGPAVGMYFAEKGAEVIKIENKKSNGDVTRSWKLAAEDTDSNISAYFCSVNWHKKHIFLDLLDEKDKNELYRLIKNADVLITNFKYGDAEKFNLTFEEVKQINPVIIHAELSGYGPKNKRVAYDLVLQAETGFMYMNGTPDSGPIKIPLAIIDILAAHQLKEGILEALLLSAKNPDKAIHVQVSLYDAAIASLANQASNYLMANHIPQPIGSLHPNIAPYGEIFETKNGDLITFAIGSDKQFKTLFDLLGLEVKAEFSTNKLRVVNRVNMASLISEKVQKWDADDLYNQLIEKGVPVGMINDLETVFNGPEAKNLILEEDIDGKLTRRVKTTVYQINLG